MINSDGLMYIGSTTKSLKSRLGGHRRACRRYLNGKYHWTSSFKLLENDDVKIELIETVDDCDTKGLHDKERYWIEYYKKKYGDKVVNKYIPNRTNAQYRKDNKERQKQYDRQHYIDNKEKLCQQHRCICGGLFTLPNKSQHIKTAKHRRFDNTLNYLKEHDPEFYNLILKDHGTNITFINNIHIHL